MDESTPDLRELILDLRASLTEGFEGQRQEVRHLNGRVDGLGVRLAAVEVKVEDVRTTVLEFRTSVSEELAETHRRMDELREDVRDRFKITETGIMNSIRDLSHNSDRRLTWVETRMAELERDVHGRPAT